MAVFRVEKNKNYTVISNYHLRDLNLSLKSKGLLSLMLSLPEEWDYTSRGLATICKEGIDCISVAIKELETYGYVTRRRIRNDKGQLKEIEYTIYEKPQNTDFEPNMENPVQDNPILEKPIQDKPVQVNPELENPTQLNTDSTNRELLNKEKNNISLSVINPSINLADNESDRYDTIDFYKQYIKKNIEYNVLCEKYTVESLSMIVDLLVDTILSTTGTIKISCNDYPARTVKSRFLALEQSHIEYVLDCFNKNTTKIHNIKAYLLAALFNAPVTMDGYYTAQVNHDLYSNE